MSYTNGSKWWPYMSSFKVLLDQCGIWLSVEQFDSDMWFAILKGVLKVRITASVVSDQRINYIAADGALGSIIPVVDKIITLPGRFKYQKFRHKVRSQVLMPMRLTTRQLSQLTRINCAKSTELPAKICKSKL
jgi:hypothetical protein